MLVGITANTGIKNTDKTQIMDSIKTKARHFVKKPNHKCIAQIMAVSEQNGFRIYVAWEWEEMAKKGVFGFCKSRKTHQEVTKELIEETADTGWDISGTEEEKEIFKNMF